MKRCDLVIVCTEAEFAKLVVANMLGARRIHFGLHEGWVGDFANCATAVALALPVENDVYVCVRHLAYLLKPACIAHLGSAAATSEQRFETEVVIVKEARPVFCPPALADNLFDCGDILFRGEDLRERLARLPLPSAPNIVEIVRLHARELVSRNALQAEIPLVVAGSMDDPLRGWRAQEFLRKKFGIEIVDTDSFGVFAAAQDCGLVSLAVKLVTDGCGIVERQSLRNVPRAWMQNAVFTLRRLVELALNPTSSAHTITQR